MSEQTSRQDAGTAQLVKEALAMQRAFGDAAAFTFLQLRNIDAALAHRVLTTPAARRQH